MNFAFATATRIVFGSGSVQEVGRSAAALGRKAFVVTGADGGRARQIEGLVASAGLEVEILRVPSEPTVDLVREGSAAARRGRSEIVVACGGGSAIDAGKAIAILATNAGDPLDYLEVIGKGAELTTPGLPVIAIPTTAGTGAEVTRNAVLSSPPDRVKVSLRSPYILPRLALVDPGLSASMPPAITASSGLDALTQLIEAFTTHSRNPVTDGMCREGLRRAGMSLLDAYRRGDARSREDMALASMLSGMALANAGLGAAHGFAGPIGGRYDAPHGAVCAALLPHTMRVNLRALNARAAETETLERYVEIAALLIGRQDATAEDGVEWIRQACYELKIPRLHSYGIEADAIPDLIMDAERSSSMRGNPISLSHEEMREILESAL
jgi:alcohol dehydrogenase class IV